MYRRTQTRAVLIGFANEMHERDWFVKQSTYKQDSRRVCSAGHLFVWSLQSAFYFTNDSTDIRLFESV